ncbi:MAG: metallophosphoesterase, partial [Clostridiaceae bacterium]|nr:metallophosphoesterase [Clostridiaceae bacterium]
SKYIWDHFNPDSFKDIDLVISCGDLKSEYLSFIATLIKAPVFYVHGNHDTQYEDVPPGGCDSIEDKIVTFKGYRILGLGGSQKYSHSLKSRPPFQYTEKQMQRRIRKLKPKLFLSKGFDILVTHAPAFGLGDGEDLCHTGFKVFNELLDKYKPSYMFHGHMHMHFGKSQRISEYNGTKIVDAFNYHVIQI